MGNALVLGIPDIVELDTCRVSNLSSPEVVSGATIQSGVTSFLFVSPHNEMHLVGHITGDLEISDKSDSVKIEYNSENQM